MSNEVFGIVVGTLTGFITGAVLMNVAWRSKSPAEKNVEEEDPEDDIAELILASMRLNPEDWSVDRFNAKHKSGVEIWIANRPYSDMRMNGNHKRIGNEAQREKMRKFVDGLFETYVSKNLKERSEELASKIRNGKGH